MVKRLFYIGLLTGLSQVLSLLSIAYIAKKTLDKVFIKQIGDIESTVVFVTIILSFGIRQIATRDIAINQNWKPILKKIQSSSIGMSIMLFFLGVLLYYYTKENHYLIFLLAPVISLNLDYAFYGLGKSVTASFLSFVRVIIPSFCLFLLGIFEAKNSLLFILSILISYLIIALISNLLLKINPYTNPSIKFYKNYLKYFYIGLSDLSISAFGLGILFFAEPLFNNNSIALSYLVIKFYVLIKGLQRILFQAFYKDLIKDDFTFLLDKIGFLIGFGIFIIACFYPKFLIMQLYSQDFLQATPLLVRAGIAVIISSIMISASPRLLLLSKEKQYIKAYLISFIIILITLLINSKFIINSEYGILNSILAGEISLFFCFAFYLKDNLEIKARLKFLLPFVVLSILYLIVKLIFGFKISSYFIVLIYISSVIYFIFKHKEIFSIKLTEDY